MRTSVITSFAFFASTMAVPAMIKRDPVCGSGLPVAQCCDTDVLGVADLDCESPPTTPVDVPDFVNICAAIGKIDVCCDVPILGQALICSVP